jgi:hypothetical protein
MKDSANDKFGFKLPDTEWRPSQGIRRRFHAMVKPIGSTCNLDCAYCYYLSKGKLLDQYLGRRISDELLESYIRQYIEGQDGDEVVFSWQGDWQLFNLKDDPAEIKDLSKQNPDKLKALFALWGEYVKVNGVILTGDSPFAKSIGAVQNYELDQSD